MDAKSFWSRVFTFIATPLKDDGEAIDEARLFETIDYQIENGVDGVCIFGSTGGNGSFSDEEMMRTTRAAARHVAGRVALVAGTGARTTTSCITLSKNAMDAGCEGIMVLPVSYWPLTTDEVFAHYERISSAVALPICIYNNPWTTGVDMKPDFLARLSKLDNVTCIKESTGDLSRISSIRRLTQDGITLIAGWESTSLQAFLAGATGWAPVCTNFVPQLAMEFFHAAGYLVPLEMPLAETIELRFQRLRIDAMPELDIMQEVRVLKIVVRFPPRILTRIQRRVGEEQIEI